MLDSIDQKTDKVITFQVEPSTKNQRLDVVLANHFPVYSRNRLSQWVKEGRVLIDGRCAQPKKKLMGVESITLFVDEEPSQHVFDPEPLPLHIIYEDQALIIVNKPANLVVHPAAGNWSGTLLNGLLYRYPDLDAVPRAGIVHRLDKDTTGLMVVARTLKTQIALIRQMQKHAVKRIYQAIVQGQIMHHQTIEKAIGRDPHNRLCMTTLAIGGKPAVTHVRILKRFERYTHIECELETGRTHQIRVHLRSIGYPILGDPLYGKRHAIDSLVSQAFGLLKRQALHAHTLALTHPISGEKMTWHSPLAQDIQAVLDSLSR